MSPLWRNKDLVGIQWFDENLRMLEDLEMHLRVLKKGLKSATAYALPL